MNSRRRSCLQLATGVVAAMVFSTGVAAESSWPTKPIRLVVSFAPGGAIDSLGRAVASSLSARLGIPVVVDNKPGAGGAVGADFVAKAPPDGYTLFISSGTFLTIGPHVYSNLPLDPMQDLVPVAAVSRGIQYLLVRADLPVKDGADFLDYLAKNSKQMNYGSAGSGTGPHIAAEMLRAQTGTEATHAPYKGSNPALMDLMAGHIDYVFEPGVGLSQLPSGKVRLLAIGGKNRAERFPDVPTLEELGVKDFNAESIFGVFAPAQTPPDIIAKLNREINATLSDARLREVITTNGAEVMEPLSPEAYAQALQEESDRFGAVVRAQNIRAD